VTGASPLLLGVDSGVDSGVTSGVTAEMVLSGSTELAESIIASDIHTWGLVVVFNNGVHHIRTICLLIDIIQYFKLSQNFLCIKKKITTVT